MRKRVYKPNKTN